MHRLLGLTRLLGPMLAVLCASTCIGQDHCWIKYKYDAAGNRIERRWWCGDPNEAEHDPKMMAQEPFGLTLAPNPARDMIRLRSDEELTNAVVTITSEEGRTKYEGRMNGTQLDLDVSTYHAGMYILRVLTGQDEYQKRFTVVH